MPFNGVFRHGDQGVAVFFIISGFLITHLLLKELRRDGCINLKRFYFRRTLRIFPPFYAYLLVISILAVLGRVQVSAASMFAAATYTWNYVPWVGGWVIAHCWSLTLEEQFYLLWPACMAFWGRRSSVWIAIGVILLSPLSRVATYYALEPLRGHTAMMLHTRLDTIMTGCLLALIIDMNIWTGFRKATLHPAAAIAASIFLLAVQPPLEERWRGSYMLPLGISVENVSILVIVQYAVLRHESALGVLLNSRLLRHCGRISYSLYLWQQLFTGPQPPAFPLNIICIVVCAELSYLFVERPSLRLRDRIEKRVLARTLLSRRPATSVSQ